MASRTRARVGSRPAATARTARSRSVSMPTRWSSSFTGSAPTFRAFILAAAAWMVSSGPMVSARSVMTSLTSMAASFPRSGRCPPGPRPFGIKVWRVLRRAQHAGGACCGARKACADARRRARPGGSNGGGHSTGNGGCASQEHPVLGRKEGTMLFEDRRDGGRRLAALLARYRDEHPVVLGLPRGGVPVAAEVARALGAPLDVVVARKLGAPGMPEYGIGAIAEGGAVFVSAGAARELSIRPEEVSAIAERESAGLLRRG